MSSSLSGLEDAIERYCHPQSARALGAPRHADGADDFGDAAETPEEAAVQYIADRFAEGVFNFKALIAALGAPLTSLDEAYRRSGLTLLAAVFHTLAERARAGVPVRAVVVSSAPDSSGGGGDGAGVGAGAGAVSSLLWLSENDFGSVTQFLCDRASKDFACARPSLDALQSVVRCHAPVYLGGASVQPANDLITRLCDGIFIPQLAQHLRGTCFGIFKAVLEARVESAAAAGTAAGGGGGGGAASDEAAATRSLVESFARAAQGEKDPRCIMVMWDCCDLVLRLLPASGGEGDLAQQVFGLLSVYYPITFKPPPTSYSITKEDLVNRLRSVLCGHAVLAKKTTRLLLDQLKSARVPIKVDVLQSLAHLFCTTSRLSVDLQIGELQEVSSAILEELVGGGGGGTEDRQLVDSALDTLRRLATVVSLHTAATGGAAWNLFARPIMTHCMDVLIAGGLSLIHI